VRHKVASKADWNHIEEVRADYPTADFINPETVFNVGGNDFRLEVVIVYRARKVYVKWVGTHSESRTSRARSWSGSFCASEASISTTLSRPGCSPPIPWPPRC
jgi:mRNA-degrading endonuclease HigB of HigAB toxin-antitoxin module